MLHEEEKHSFIEPSNSGEINLENTNNRSFSKELLSDNSSYRFFDDNLKVIDKRNISI